MAIENKPAGSLKVKTLQIHWHDKQAVYSVDFEPGTSERFATGGADNAVRIWKIQKSETEPPNIQFRSTLSRHSAAVNVVRWSPKGGVLATGGDDASIILWREAPHTAATQSAGNIADEDEEENLETWRLHNHLKIPTGREIYDLAWSPDANYIISACFDNVARIWDTRDGKCIHAIEDHTHVVQGVAWDPLEQYLATQSSDRSVHIYSYDIKPTGVTVKRLASHSRIDTLQPAEPSGSRSNTPIPPPQSSPTKPAAASSSAAPIPEVPVPAPVLQPPTKMRMYRDETLVSFFRRLTFSPDGSLLITPTGQYKLGTGKNDIVRNATFVYTRGGIRKQPVVILPNMKKPSIAVRFNPRFYELEERQTQATFLLPHRLIFAVAAQDAVLIYDTQAATPLALMKNLHYATINDIAWSYDGTTLMLVSSDGFCSMVVFDKEELGMVIARDPTAAMDGVEILSTGVTVPDNVAMRDNDVEMIVDDDESRMPDKKNEGALSQAKLMKFDMAGSAADPVRIDSVEPIDVDSVEQTIEVEQTVL
ncbi:hypothetical protein SmJEL517_g00770 [Synchytrium microbalum]|uniref:CAF1B/HIR1 beta-propeller domain-containing protein n=1 Tax=Synchytrium microbalum TaxID=1806994 RepID=A0A507CEN5_9FUNG|nr:uncharacterized protein SmJEL517_g00770 [Synchytrium microbalum]TPX37649.1 hypothetical protein SmJEL517_g00770 [Synchytrium microbalum]